MKLENFGRTVSFEPFRLCVPADSNEVLSVLERWRGEHIRAFGGLHAWSGAAVSANVALDLRHFNKVTLERQDDGTLCAEIEGGCTIDAVLEYLRLHGGYTLPTYGIIGKQTIAGAIATATHGSGPASMSHHILAMSVAAYDDRGEKARIHHWDGGEALRAARCGVGCTGIVLSVRMPVEPDFLIEEQTRWFAGIDQVLDLEREFPRQQFYLVPWSWNWLAQLRRPLARGPGVKPSGTAWLHRIFRQVGVDAVLNGVVRLLAGYVRSPAGIQWFYRRVFPLITGSGMHVIDQSSRMLRMRHDLYRHVEMELFVPAAHIQHAAAFVEWVLRWCAGEDPEMPAALTHDDFGRDAVGGVAALRGCYVHDYLVTFRRVLADDTLISMTSGDTGAWYAVSLITYQRDRAPFLRMARFVAAAMASAYRARPHWGKICPLETDEIAALYPMLDRFRAQCASVDPNQVFINDFARRALGFQ